MRHLWLCIVAPFAIGRVLSLSVHTLFSIYENYLLILHVTLNTVRITMTPQVSLVRHAQGLHNLCEANNSLRDPALTPLGKEQCELLHRRFSGHETITHLLASPLRRTLETCILSFSTAVRAGIKITALPDAQEISGLMCDIGTERSQLEAEFGEKVDFSLVLDNWNDKSELSRFAPTATKLERRARDVRLWIQDIAKQEGEDAHIVLVSHGGILHFITQEWDDIKPGRGKLPPCLEHICRVHGN